MESIEYLPNGLSLLQNEHCFRLGQDSVLLSDFAKIPKRARVLDLCCGSGALALLTHRADLTTVGLELQAASVDLFTRSIAHNSLQNVSVLQGDLRQIRTLLSAGQFDYIVCNPPYFATNSGYTAQKEAIRTARADDTADLLAVAQALAFPLRSGGKCAVVFRPERLCELMATLQSVRLMPKRMRLVHSTATAPPSAVMLECRKDGAYGLQIEPPLLVRNPDGTESDEVQRIYQREKQSNCNI